MRTRKIIGMCAAILITHGVVNQSRAQIDYGMPELNNTASLRSLALGSATVAMDGYPGAAQINPASIGLINIIQGNSYFSLPKSGSIFGKYYRYTSLFQPNFDYRSDKWAAALFTTYYDLGEQTQTDAQGNLLGRFRSYQLGISGSVSWELSSDLRVGVGLRYLTSNFGFNPVLVGGTNFHIAHSVAIDLGILYQRSFETEYMTLRPSAGWSLTNFGTPLRYSSTASDPLPMTVRGGLGLRMISNKKMYDRPILSVGIYTAFSHILARKKADGTAYGPFQAFVKGWSPYNYDSYYTGSTQHVSFADQFYSHFGMEVSILGALSYRFGYVNQPKALGYHNQKMFGIGADLYYIAFDYTRISNVTDGYNALSNDTGIWQITIRLPLKRPAGGIIPSLVD